MPRCWSRRFAISLIALGVVVVLLGGCNSKVGLGGQCKTGCGPSGCPSPTYSECESGLYCSESGSCRAPLGPGGDCTPLCQSKSPGECNTACADGLTCAVATNKCTPLGREGATCAQDSDCQSKFCNHGYFPEDSQLGECHTLYGSAEGQPCRWPSSVVTGCAVGLVCIPLPRVVPSATSFDEKLACPSAKSCGFAGTCRAPGKGANGSECLANDACESNRCDPIAVPLGKEGTPGFYCPGARCNYEGPWPGICVAKDALTDNAICDDTKPCADGYKCDLGFNPHRCAAKWTLVGPPSRAVAIRSCAVLASRARAAVRAPVACDSKRPMRIVIDTNVLISALLNPGRTPDRALVAIRQRGDVVLYDERMLGEYRDVLSREKFRAIGGARAEALIASLIAQGESVVVSEPYAKVMIDDGDRIFVEVALAGHAEALATGNVRHYPTDEGFDVLPPAALLARMALT